MKRMLLILLAALALLCCIGCRINGELDGSLPSQIPTTQNGGTTVNTTWGTEDSAEVTTIPSESEQNDSVATEPETTVPPTTVPLETEQHPTDPPITEPVDAPEDEELVRVLDYIPSVRQALVYATAENFTGQVIYDFTDAYLRYGTVKKLAQVCRELAEQGLGLLIWDGFRPVSAQAKLWQICPDPTYVSPPGTGTQNHCRGIAVDVTLVDLQTGALLPMPSGFDEFSALGDRDYGDCSPEAAQNAMLLEQTMVKYGFKPYAAEWWHFSDTESYPIEENFDPGLSGTWVANCNVYINLRKTPGGELIGRVYKDETMRLLEWFGKYAKVSYNGMVGYVSAAYIKPADDTYFDGALDTVGVTNVYRHEQMMSDIDALVAQYPDLVSWEIIGRSELGRDIPVLRIGSQDASKHVLVQGAIHGREHLTAWLVMALADHWLDHGASAQGDICYHFIPMCNPDGVVISQTGVLNEEQREIYLRDRQLGYTSMSEAEYAARWKANGLGVDLNRNFAAGWESVQGRKEPSSQLYPGEAPFSAAEAKVLRDYTLRYNFGATISYHATGSLIYYEYGGLQPVNDRSKDLAVQVEAVTGYPLQHSNGVDGAGYKDWAMSDLQIPSLTVEIGCNAAPLAHREVYSIFARNCDVLKTVASWLTR